MKKALLGTTALLGAGLVASPALAADGIKLAVGGFFREAFMVVIDDHGEGELGNEHNTDGFFNDAEVHFKGETKLDNGLTVGARVELEGENDDDQIDEAWIYFSGGFGQIRIGSDDEALANSCILPPGGTTNFSAFSPNQWGANTTGVAGAFGLASNADCIGVDDRKDAQKILYFTPVFGGFQLTVSYTPNGGDERHDDVAGPHVGMPFNNPGESRHNVSAYATYTYKGEDWGLTAGGGGSWEGEVRPTAGGPDRDEQDFYQAALNLTFGQFAIGGVFEYFNNFANFSDGRDRDIWVAGGGISYTVDAWKIGAQYSHQSADSDGGSSGPGGFNTDFTMDRVVLTGNYVLGPGINIDAELGYTWIDTDPEDTVSSNDLDDYQGFEFGIGTAITF